MAENLVFKGKLVLFCLDWFSLVWFVMWQFVRDVLASIHTKFELSRCLVTHTIGIKICSVLHFLSKILKISQFQTRFTPQPEKKWLSVTNLVYIIHLSDVSFKYKKVCKLFKKGSYADNIITRRLPFYEQESWKRGLFWYVHGKGILKILGNNAPFGG